jgi:hypothetical protein
LTKRIEKSKSEFLLGLNLEGFFKFTQPTPGDFVSPPLINLQHLLNSTFKDGSKLVFSPKYRRRDRSTEEAKIHGSVVLDDKLGRRPTLKEKEEAVKSLLNLGKGLDDGGSRLEKKLTVNSRRKSIDIKNKLIRESTEDLKSIHGSKIQAGESFVLDEVLEIASKEIMVKTIYVMKEDLILNLANPDTPHLATKKSRMSPMASLTSAKSSAKLRFTKQIGPQTPKSRTASTLVIGATSLLDLNKSPQNASMTTPSLGLRDHGSFANLSARNAIIRRVESIRGYKAYKNPNILNATTHNSTQDPENSDLFQQKFPNNNSTNIVQRMISNQNNLASENSMTKNWSLINDDIGGQGLKGGNLTFQGGKFNSNTSISNSNLLTKIFSPKVISVRTIPGQIKENSQ